MFSGRFVDTPFDRPRWRFTATCRLHRRLQAGAELNPAAGEVGPLFSLFLVTETERRPALFLGTSSDRIGSPEGTQSWYGTASKYVAPVRTSFYATLNWSEWDDGLNVPFGASVELGRGFSARYMFDGDRSHLLANWFASRFGISLMYIWLERPGISVSAGL